MLWLKLKGGLNKTNVFCAKTVFYTKSRFTQKPCYTQTPCFTQKPCSCWACARAACGLQDGSFHGGWTRRRRLNMCRSWANSSQRRAAVEERQSRAEENMRALRAKANADMLQNVFSILTWSMTTIIIVRNINHCKIQENTRYYAHSWLQTHNPNDEKPTPVSRRCSHVFPLGDFETSLIFIVDVWIKCICCCCCVFCVSFGWCLLPNLFHKLIIRLGVSTVHRLLLVPSQYLETVVLML